ncbi:hypothetical protein BDM02DRAFT_1760157 [Thelephora ganbajun]|uniref:Uncharacterized protein n=1 Tax=Thelephora ganbajun TaxID=370292 RepID=A0ACB6Z0K4_THEGA|nr:hypothetical protein BDM02DRAFT_1760157 [Thelephora ganbajun]
MLANGSTVIAADPENDDVKRGLAEVYEILGETRKALNLVSQVIDARGRQGARHGKQGTVTSQRSLLSFAGTWKSLQTVAAMESFNLARFLLLGVFNQWNTTDPDPSHTSTRV